jgi:hypothetical protein
MRTAESGCIRRSRPGHTLYVIMVLLLSLGAMTMSFFAHSTLAMQMLTSDVALTGAGYSAESVVDELVERLIARAEERLGMLTNADISALNRGASADSLGLPEGMSLVSGETGYSVISTTSSEVLPHDLVPLRVIPDQLRASWTVAPSFAGAVASQSIEVQVRATVSTRRGGRRGAIRRLVISKVAPHPYAVYASGDLDLCVSEGSTAAISGALRAEGSVVSWCDGDRLFGGPLLAGEGIVVQDGGEQVLLWQGGDTTLTSVGRTGLEGATSAVLARYGGRVSLGRVFGERAMPTRMQTAQVPGSGECRDFELACGGAGAYLPSVELQRVVTGPEGPVVEVRCGEAYNGNPCDLVSQAVSYRHYPLAEPGENFTAAVLDPDNLTRHWAGLLPDYRRMGLCDAAMGNQSFRTFRCPSGPYGFTLDVSALPGIPGGLLAVRRSSAPGADRQEVLVLRAAQRFAAPLTILSEIPVYILGNLNVLDPVPVMIDAPLITVLPAETEAQLRQSRVWDVVGQGVPKILRAHSPVTIRAVLRSDYHVSTQGLYYGGLLEQIPAVLGDFSGVSLTVLGAVEGRQVPIGTPGSYSTIYFPYGQEPSGMTTLQPASRRVVYDVNLRNLSFQPRGSWVSDNLPASREAPLRTRQTQQNAVGGFTVIRQVHETLQTRFRTPGSQTIP